MFKYIKWYTLKICNFLYVSQTSIKWLKKKKEKENLTSLSWVEPVGTGQIGLHFWCSFSSQKGCRNIESKWSCACDWTLLDLRRASVTPLPMFHLEKTEVHRRTWFVQSHLLSGKSFSSIGHHFAGPVHASRCWSMPAWSGYNLQKVDYEVRETRVQVWSTEWLGKLYNS